MVYPGNKEKREAAVEEYMATGHDRSKPLHSFTLPHLKWGNQRFLRCMKADSADGTDHRIRRRTSPSRFGKSSFQIATGRQENERTRHDPEPRSRNRRSVAAPSGSGSADDGEEGIDEVREQIMLDLKEVMDTMRKSLLSEGAWGNEDEDEQPEERHSKKARHREKQTEKKKEKQEEPTAAVEDVPWNLRTRKGAASKGPIGYDGSSFLNNHSGHKNRGPVTDKNRANYRPMRSDASASPSAAVKENKERPVFSVPLNKKEIEEDFMAMAGRRPARRPKKRQRNVQKQMNTLFPGLWLTEITPDLYEVPESDENKKR